jgi:tRNA(fMet)-specific endonuclease VapC
VIDRRYLLDTSTLSDLMRNPSGATARRFARKEESRVCTSIIVACELRFGARKRNSPALIDRVEQILRSLEILPLEVGVDSTYAAIRLELEDRGEPIGANDLLIAAHALARGLVLVTANAQEFRRVRGLMVENWLATRG